MCSSISSVSYNVQEFFNVNFLFFLVALKIVGGRFSFVLQQVHFCREDCIFYVKGSS